MCVCVQETVLKGKGAVAALGLNPVKWSLHFQPKLYRIHRPDGFHGLGYLTCSDDTVRCFDLTTGKTVKQWGGNGAGRGKFWNPRGLALFGGELFVVDMHNHRVQVRARNSAQFEMRVDSLF